jgi:hypothetical protein
LLLTGGGGGNLSQPRISEHKHQVCSHTDRLVVREFKGFSVNLP